MNKRRFLHFGITATKPLGEDGWREEGGAELRGVCYL